MSQPRNIPLLDDTSLAVRLRLIQECLRERPGNSLVGLTMKSTSGPVVLTYDDGPDTRDTSAVLRALTKAGFSATFFVLISRVRLNASLVRDTLQSGNEVALHGMDHRKLTELSTRSARLLIRSARAELEDTIGREVVWYRPPYGEQNRSAWLAVIEEGLIPVVWSQTLRDWLNLHWTEQVSSAMKDVRPGDIVLSHDGFAGIEDGVDDGPPPLIDKASLATRLFGAMADRRLQGRSLASALTSGYEAVLTEWITDSTDK